METAKALMPSAEYQLPYEGAKEMLLVEDIENSEFLKMLFEVMFEKLSESNICAVYTDQDYRCKGIAGRLLNMAVEDLRGNGISPVYLLTDHVGFNERYGWKFLCMVQGDGEDQLSRMYIHR